MTHTTTTHIVRTAGMPAALCGMQLVLAYEWLVSGINKFANAGFLAQLAGNLRDGMKGNPYGFYTSILQQFIVPHAQLFGALSEIGELLTGLVLGIAALLWLLRPHSSSARLFGYAAVLALLGSIVLAINYFLMSGDPLPWINPGNAFNEGVSIDLLIPLLSIPLILANLRAARAARSDTFPRHASRNRAA